jgi:cysteine desulfurase
MNNLIYLDTSASTPLDPEVYKEMHKYFHLEYGNAGSMHSKGLMASHALNLSRNKVAVILNCQPREIIFTGSGTESINFAIKGVASKYKAKGNHIITSNIEHHAVLDTLEYLEKKDFKVTYIPVEKNGIVDPKKIEKAITKETILITIMYSNNEIGTIQPIKEISELTKNHNIIFHTDACQSGNSEELDIEELGVDLMSLNGSKIYGPKGIGCLYKKDEIKLEPLIHGGGQEFNLRSGTENIPSIVGFAKALEIAQKNKEGYTKKLTKLRDYLIENLLIIENTLLNGDTKERLPNNANITFLNIEGEAILLKLDKEGICASSGSACTSKSLDPSHVILALGRPYEAAHGSIRFSLSKYTTKEGIDKLIKVMPKIVKELRGMSPVILKMEDAQGA